MSTYDSIDDIRQANAEAGLRFFDEHKRIYDGHVGKTVYGGRYFVTSEKYPTGRRYTIREALLTGWVFAVGGAGDYASREAAIVEIKRLLKEEDQNTRKRIQRGIQKIDAYDADPDEPLQGYKPNEPLDRPWYECIDLDLLDIADGFCCVLGQLWEDGYGTGADVLFGWGRPWGSTTDYGFALREDESPERLNQLWKEAIQKKREAQKA